MGPSRTFQILYSACGIIYRTVGKEQSAIAQASNFQQRSEQISVVVSSRVYAKCQQVGSAFAYPLRDGASVRVIEFAINGMLLGCVHSCCLLAIPTEREHRHICEYLENIVSTWKVVSLFLKICCYIVLIWPKSACNCKARVCSCPFLHQDCRIQGIFHLLFLHVGMSKGAGLFS